MSLLSRHDWPVRGALLVALLWIRAPDPGCAASVEEVALAKTAARQTLLEEGAKKEGKLLWYTTLIVNQALKPIKEAFEKKYPYVAPELLFEKEEKWVGLFEKMFFK